MSSDAMINVDRLGKCFQIYEQPRDRLKQFLFPRARRFVGLPTQNYFREFWALRNVSFQVHEGETVGIVGRNGGGKSTLLQIICGTLSATEGEVTTRGRIAALLELGAGFNPEFSGRENVYMNGAILGLSSHEMNARFEEISRFADIGEFLDRPVKTYSSGMLVRLAFSVAINVDPQILIVDEALSVGDERFQRKCFARIEEIKRKGATVLFVSHSSGTVIELCDRAIMLDGGELITQGRPKIVISAYQKLLYAPEVARESIRQELRHPFFSEAKAGDKDIVSQLASMSSGTDSRLPEMYDSGLRSVTTVEYESRGARIVSPAIYSMTGEKVNHLNKGVRYRYIYSVEFERAAGNVGFGMLIKTLSGIELGGSTTAPSGVFAIPLVEAGTRVVVTFDFLCQLNPGVYFTNAGVSGDVDGEHTFLHRILDAYMFRVQPFEGDTATAIVDFDCRADIAIDTASAEVSRA